MRVRHNSVVKNEHQLYTAEQVRHLDTRLAHARGVPSLQLMQDAAAAALHILSANWPEAQRIIVLAGSGNNAGDGWHLAELLHQRGRTVEVYCLKEPAALTGDAATVADSAITAGCHWQRCQDTTPDLETADLIVDAILGTGLSGVLRTEYAALINRVNTASTAVFSLDIPSGLQADTGVSMSGHIIADITITFVAYKRGLFTGDGIDACGKVVLADLGLSAFPEVCDHIARSVRLLSAQLKWPDRPANSHKNRFGTVVVIAGNRGMAGAGLLSAQAALHCGAGLVTLVTHPGHVAELHTRQPELMLLDSTDQAQAIVKLIAADTIVFGPGLGNDDWSEQCWELLHIALAERLSRPCNLIMDADGLRYLPFTFPAEVNLVITPHPGEAARLLDADSATIQQDRFQSSMRLAETQRSTVVLKGAGTIISNDEGKIALCPFGNPGMATAGMGDVLTGVLAAVLSQQSDLYTAVCNAVVIHSRAGDAAAGVSGQTALLAGSLNNAFPGLLP